MRIRKRQPVFPLPSFSHLPLSDPHLINSSPVVQLNHIPPPPLRLDHSHPSDHHPLPPICNSTNASDDSPGEAVLHHQDANQYGLEQDGRAGAEKKDNDPRKGSILGSETTLPHLLQISPSSSTPSQDGRWCEGEKAIPLKKRKGMKVEEAEAETWQNNNNNKTKALKSRMKTKMNKKCSRNNEDQDYDEEEELEEEKKGNVGKKRGGRGRGRGSAVMEGSRCSRVNGRGWRCCQQTLVGYSLCEHHLGKGRLRSITAVKSTSLSLPTANHIAPPPPPSSSSPDELAAVPVVNTKKRMKLGVVKARSIRSLLGQTTTQLPHNK